MVILMSDKQFFAQIKAFGFTFTGLKDDATGVSLWEYDGKVYSLPLSHDDEGTKYCPLALKFFLKKVSGSKEASGTKSHSDIEYLVSSKDNHSK